jgi:hypothetical protein
LDYGAAALILVAVRLLLGLCLRLWWARIAADE